MKKIKQKKSHSDDDLILEFYNVKFFVIPNPDKFSDKDISRIENIVKIMSDVIYIDKSYVDFPENKYNDVFLEFEGWENLCKLIKKTNYGEKSGEKISLILIDSFKLIITTYMYYILSLYDYNIEDITLDLLDSEIVVKYFKDTTQYWKYNPGPWQDWGLKNNE